MILPSQFTTINLFLTGCALIVNWEPTVTALTSGIRQPVSLRHTIVASKLKLEGHPSRREVFSKCIVGGVAIGSIAIPSPASAAESDFGYKIYQVIPDASSKLSPSIKAMKSNTLMKVLLANNNGGSGAIWLGEHHSSAIDHQVQADLIQSVYTIRTKQGKNKNVPPMAIGLEQVQIQFQPVLDKFLTGEVSESEMLEQVEWEKRWYWPYEVYKPIFRLARDLNIKLLALNVNSEDLADVERGGLPGLSADRLRTYIPDPYGFAAFAKPESFKTYVSYVIRPSYEMHREMGLLRSTMSGQGLDGEMSYRNFYSGRILWDEGMASKAYQWTKNNPGGLLVGLVGADHVKFGKGIPARYARMAGREVSSTSILLNPTLIDTRPSGSVSSYGGVINRDPNQITLQLRYVKDDVDVATQENIEATRYTGGVLPLADYILVSDLSRMGGSS